LSNIKDRGYRTLVDTGFLVKESQVDLASQQTEALFFTSGEDSLLEGDESMVVDPKTPGTAEPQKPGTINAKNPGSADSKKPGTSDPKMSGKRKDTIKIPSTSGKLTPSTAKDQKQGPSGGHKDAKKRTTEGNTDGGKDTPRSAPLYSVLKTNVKETKDKVVRELTKVPPGPKPILKTDMNLVRVMRGQPNPDIRIRQDSKDDTQVIRLGATPLTDEVDMKRNKE
jgi:hypothetical protein